MRKILVLRGGALGDFIVTLPTLAALKGRWPEAEIDFVGNRTAAEIALREGLIDRAHSQHEARWSALYDGASLPTELNRWLSGFDLVINYWPNADGALRRHFPCRSDQLFTSAEPMPTEAPAAAHYARALKSLGIAMPEPFYRLKIAEKTKSAKTIAPAAIAIHPGSGSTKKNWPVENWSAVLKQVATPVFLILGEAEEAHWAAARRLAHGQNIRVAQNLSLLELIAELSSCRLFLGHDSGISHLAAACGVPSVLLFGPTEPTLWAPPAAHVSVLRRGEDLRSIMVDEVLQTVNRGVADR